MPSGGGPGAWEANESTAGWRLSACGGTYQYSENTKLLYGGYTVHACSQVAAVTARLQR